MIAQVKKVPVIGTLWTFAETRPRIAAWIVLSLGIIVLLLIEARDVGLLIGQWLALFVASIVVAGLCIWIVSWEDQDEQAVEAVTGSPAPAKIVAAPGSSTATVVKTTSAEPVVSEAAVTEYAAPVAPVDSTPTDAAADVLPASDPVVPPIDPIDPIAPEPHE